MSQALEEPIAKGQKFSNTASIPAPVKGWNTIDPLAAMEPQYAVQLDNWIPQPSYIEMRGGSKDRTLGLQSQVLSLIPYIAGVTRKLFAVAGHGIFDVTNPGVAGSLLYAISNPQNWNYIQFSTVAGVYATACNGADPAAFFDGVTWQAAAITGVNPALLACLTSYQGRIWYTEVNSLRAWYLAPAAIQGAATEFDLGTVFHEGGSLVGIATWSLDAGDGPLEYLVFVTDQGECAVYQGTDPSSISTFSKVGVYKLPKPIGRKVFLKFGGDVLIITQQGVYPLSKALLSSTLERSSAITYQISSQFVDDFENFGSNYGWEMTLYTERNLLVVNIPGAAPDGTNAQYVMNTLTGAWCRFLGWNASCFVDFEGQLLFGKPEQQNFVILSSGKVLTVSASLIVLGFSSGFVVAQGFYGGADDAGQPVTGTVMTAYNYLAETLANKGLKMMRPNLTITNSLDDISVAISTDFRALATSDYAEIEFETPPLSPPKFVPALQWMTPASIPGFAVSAAMAIDTLTAKVRLASFDLLFELGSGVM